MPVLVWANGGTGEPTAAFRRVYFHLVGTDGITPATGEAGGQPQMVFADAWTNSGIGTLTALGNGRYYAVVEQSYVTVPGTRRETRYKSANTAECPGDTLHVVAFDPHDAVRLGLTALPNAAADAAGGLAISDAGGLDLDQILNVVEADVVLDKTDPDQWKVQIKKKGTETVLLTKNLKDHAGTAIAATTARVATQVQP